MDLLINNHTMPEEISDQEVIYNYIKGLELEIENRLDKQDDALIELSKKQVQKQFFGTPSTLGNGDMTKVVYDSNNDGIVNQADTITDQGDLATLDTVDTDQIDNHAVTNTKLEQMNANTVKGRLSGNGTPQDIAMSDLPISDATQTALDDKQDILAEGAFVNGDKTKLDGIEAGADVTDTTNVAAAGAAMTTGGNNFTGGRNFFSANGEPYAVGVNYGGGTTMYIGADLAGNLKISNVGGTERLSLTQGGDLTVNGQNRTSGWTSWTPTVSGGGGGTPGAYASQDGSYKQIGKMVYFQASVLVAKNTLSGDVRMSLPLTPSGNTQETPLTGWLANQSTGNNAKLGEPYIVNAQAYIQFISSYRAGNQSWSTMGANVVMQVSGFYTVA